MIAITFVIFFYWLEESYRSYPHAAGNYTTMWNTRGRNHRGRLRILPGMEGDYSK